ncbi:MAG TPA: response regulator [Opitutaceae bacterium]|jgi:DNA-binding NarL/FixJ family response regulator
MSLPRVLLLDDDPTVHRAVELRLRGFADLTACCEAAAAVEVTRKSVFDAALIDVNLGDTASGIETIMALRAVDPDLAPVVFTAHSDFDTAVEAFRVHAFDFVPKSLRQDEEFRVKLNQAIAHTRARRALTRHAGEAMRLRAELKEAIVRGQLEITTGDIQRGLLADSLESFSALLGRIELIDYTLQQRLASAPELADVVLLSRSAVNELHEYVGNLRDYFAAPDRAAESVNRLLARAGDVARADLHGGGEITVADLRPDQPVRAEARAVLRAVTVLLRLAAQASPGARLVVTPSVMFNPLFELNALRARPTARVLQMAEVRREDKSAIAIEIVAPLREADVDALAALFAPDNPRNGTNSAWAALAMLARAGAALAVENRREMDVRFLVVLKS